MKLFFLILFAAITIKSSAQLDKKTWLAGGSASLQSYNMEYKSSFNNSTAKFTHIEISAPVAYFVADKLAFGLKPTFSSVKGKVTSPGGGSTNLQRYWIGPFGRYYLLKKDQRYNIVTEASYQFGFLHANFNATGQKGDLSTFSVLAGPVLYFNNTVGIEFLLGYGYTKEDVKQGAREIRKGFQTGIGFQIHLKK